MSLHKINYHSHTKYSDGNSTLLEMAERAQNLGHCAYVVTDHYYAREVGTGVVSRSFSMTTEKYCRQLREAKEVEDKLGFPVICGIESVFNRCEEINVFGRDAILFLLDSDVTDFERFRQMREEFECACILNHPSLYQFTLHRGPEIIDGFEYFNHGCNFFRIPTNPPEPNEKREVPDFLIDKHPFSNSDAHHADGLDCAHNLTDIDVKTEADLIRSIKQGPKALVYWDYNQKKLIEIDRADLCTV